MSHDPRFDEVARSYDAVVQKAIGPSGESVQFFADLKVRLMAESLGNRTPATILDFGCGIGNTTRSIARRFGASKVVGFDTSSESLGVARDASEEFGKRVEYLVDARSLPLHDATINVAFAACVFHHIDLSEREHWGAELRRVLVPRGFLFLFEHNPFNPLTVQVVKNVPFDEGVELLRPDEARRLLERCGLKTSRPVFYFFFPRALGALRAIEPALRSIPIGAQYYVLGQRGG